MVRLALRSALSDRAGDGHVKIVDDWGIDEPKTKRGIEVLDGLGLRPEGQRAPRVLLVLDRTEHAVWKSFRNLGERVQIVLPDELNAYDIILNDWIVFSKATLESTIARFGSQTPRNERRQGAERAPAGGVSPPAASDAERRRRRRPMRDARDVIIRPVVSEKSYASYDENVYTFIVAEDANKVEIRQAIEAIFNVKVTKVNTLNRVGKRKRNRRTGGFGQRSGQKRAIVSLAEGNTIEIFGG